MLFVNVGLARRLEGVAAAVGAECACACAKHFPELKPVSIKVVPEPTSAALAAIAALALATCIWRRRR